jgi:hypothetical protein
MTNTINHERNQQQDAEDINYRTVPVEAYGTTSTVRSTKHWQKTFKSRYHLNAWVAKQTRDVEVIGTRDAEAAR